MDRSPTGPGVTARVALAAARGTENPGDSFLFESLTGSVFRAWLEENDGAGPERNVRVRVGGEAAYCGTCRFTLQRGDVLGRGFKLAGA